MTTITIEGIKVYAYHGHLKEEAILGGHFNVNVWIEVNTDIVEESDELTDTLDYVKVISIVKEQMLIRSNMIEVPTARIAKKILKEKNIVMSYQSQKLLIFSIGDTFLKETHL